MNFRATPTETGWKVERRIAGCSNCGTATRWQTLFYSYPLIPRTEAEQYAKATAELLNKESS